MLNESLNLNITQVSELLRNREISPKDLTDLTFDRIERVEGKINSYITLLSKEARRAAKTAEEEIMKGKFRAPLHGIPLGVKDIIDTRGVTTTYGSKIFKNNIPTLDASVVERLKKAGAMALSGIRSFSLVPLP